MQFTRVTVDPDLMGGFATVRGLRIPLATVVAMVAEGISTEEFFAELPELGPRSMFVDHETAAGCLRAATRT